MTSAFGTVAQLPLAPGTTPVCNQYYNHFSPVLIDQAHSNGISSPSQSSCKSIADKSKVDVENLIQSNPSLSRDNCELKQGFSYCVLKIVDDGEREQLLYYYPLTQELISTVRPPSSKATPTDPPICTFDPVKGEYVCPPTCTFDPEKGEYICPEAAHTDIVGRKGSE